MMKKSLAFLVSLSLFLQCTVEEPDPVADFKVQGGVLEALTPIEFENRSTGAKSYAWNFGNGVTYDNRTPNEQIYPTEGSYTVSLTVTNGDGVSDTKTITLAIGPPPDVFARFQAPNDAKIGEAVLFKNTSGFANTYLWDFGSGVQGSNEESPTRTFSTPGTRDVILTAYNSKGSHSFTKSIEICDKPVAAFKTLTNVYTYDAGADIVFVSTSTKNASDQATTYKWILGNGNTIPTSASPNATYSYSTAGVYTVSLIVSNPCGKDTISKDVTIQVPAITMKSIAAGTFVMGCISADPDCDTNENPPHNVTLSAYQMSETEVTQFIWLAVMGSNPSDHDDCKQCPVEDVSWFDAVVFCNRLSEMHGLIPCYHSNSAFTQVYGKNGNVWSLPNSGDVYWKTFANGYRLPTEAEWERAAKGGVNNQIYSGSNTLNNVGWHSGISSTSQPVKGKSANQFGLFDMSGNVYEWCYDWYVSNYYSNSPNSNPPGPSTGSNRVPRGGSYFNDPTSSRNSNRNSSTPDNRYSNFGFRISKNN